eukprot:5178820-Pyramimonas_sp.AAC.1
MPWTHCCGYSFFPGSDQMRGRFDVATSYAILRIRFAPLTYIPRDVALMVADSSASGFGHVLS